MRTMQLAKAALLLIDLQKAIDDPRWASEGPRNNADAEGCTFLIRLPAAAISAPGASAEV